MIAAQGVGGLPVGEATGYFHAQEIDGVWWLINPDGNVFISKGVTMALYQGYYSPKLGYAPYHRTVEAKYGSAAAWAKEAASRLNAWGLNTFGSWCDNATKECGMPYAVDLGITRRSGGNWQYGVFPDVFAEAFRESADQIAREVCAPLRDDPYMLGYFTDNELKWGADWRSHKGLFADYWELEADAPGRKRAEAFIEVYYDGDIDRFNAEWSTAFPDWAALKETRSLNVLGVHVGKAQKTLRRIRIAETAKPDGPISYVKTFFPNIDAANAAALPHYGKPRGTTFKSFEEMAEFMEASLILSPFGEVLRDVEAAFTQVVAEQYFKVVTNAVRKYDPNHLILGCRFAGFAPEEVLAVIGDHMDVVTFNHYGSLPPEDTLRRIHGRLGKPILLTEFSFAAMDSGLPNTRGPGMPLATQEDRADAFERYVTALMKLPFVVGYHWHKYADEPAEGCRTGENSNYGLVNTHDKPYEILTTRMAEVNSRMEAVHLAVSKP
jgi:agarase